MKKVSLAVLAATIFATSCSDETTIYKDTEDDISIEGNRSILENSIIFDDAGVLEIIEDNSLSGKSAKGAEQPAGDYPLTLVARVDPPSYSGGENLTASHVHVDGNYAYVAYNTADIQYAGAIDIIDVSDPYSPVVTSRLYYSNADINSIKYDDGYVYAAGGVDSEKSVMATANSFIVKISASAGKMNVGAGLIYGFQEGFNATDVEVTTNAVLVTSGKDGLLTAYNKSDLSVQNDISFSDLRSVAADDSTIAILDGSKGVTLLDTGFNVTSEIDIDSDFGLFSKRTIALSGEKIVVSEGSKGAGVYNKNTGLLIEYVPILVNPDGVEQSNVVTNAVAINEEVLLMANGGAGLCLSEDQGDNTDLVGIIELDGSINYVESKGDYIFAASGKAGLQIVKLNRPNESLVSRCADLLEYTGNSTLEVSAGEIAQFSGAKRLSKIEVEGSLLLCGSWTVNNDVKIKEDGLFEMYGTLAVGRNNKRKDIVVEENAIFKVEGIVTIYGDLELKENSKLEFIGEESAINIFGSVKKEETAEVKGNFVDVQNKF